MSLGYVTPSQRTRIIRLIDSQVPMPMLVGGRRVALADCQEFFDVAQL